MQARVKWVEGLTFLGESSSGHQVMMDGNSGDKAPSPMEMVLMAAGGCSAIDVVSILQKGRNDVVDCEVKLSSERREEAPASLPISICILSSAATHFRIKPWHALSICQRKNIALSPSC